MTRSRTAATLEDVREQLARQQTALTRTIADVDVLLGTTPPVEPPGVPVHVGDDLEQMIDTHPPGTVFDLDSGLIATDLTIRQPCTLRGPLAPAAPPTVSGTVQIAAADVTLERLDAIGLRPDDTVITCAAGTRVLDCRVMGSTSGQRRGIAVNAPDILIAHTTVVGMTHSEDSQAICGWTGTRNLIVRECVLEASGENIMFGGADAASAEDIPTNILIERCLLEKDPAWRGQPNCTVKNLFELKCARNVRVRECTLRHCWAHGQDGYGLVLTVRNQDGGAPYSTIENVVIEDCTFEHIGAGINVLGRDDTYPSGIMRDVTIRRCAFTDVSHVAYGGSARTVQINGGPVDLTLEAITVTTDVLLNSALYLDGPPLERFRVVGCDWYEGEYGIFAGGTLGEPALAQLAPGYHWADVIVHKTQSERWINWPAGTRVVEEPADA